MTTPQTGKTKKTPPPVLTPEQETAQAVATRDRIRRLYKVELHTVAIEARGDWSNYGADVYAEKSEADAAIRGLASDDCETCRELSESSDENDVDELESHLTEFHDYTISRGTATTIIPADYLMEVDEAGEPHVTVVNDTWDDELTRELVTRTIALGGQQ